MGVFIASYILFVQIRSFVLVMFNNRGSLFFLDAIFASSIIILMNTSFINLTFLFLIYYKARNLDSFQSEKLINKLDNI